MQWRSNGTWVVSGAKLNHSVLPSLDHLPALCDREHSIESWSSVCWDQVNISPVKNDNIILLRLFLKSKADIPSSMGTWLRLLFVSITLYGSGALHFRLVRLTPVNVLVQVCWQMQLPFGFKNVYTCSWHTIQSTLIFPSVLTRQAVLYANSHCVYVK